MAQRDGFPYLVDLQSGQLDQFSTRLVMPLARLGIAPAALPRRLTQAVLVKGERLFPAAHLCAPLPTRQLKRTVASVRGQADVFRDALDAVISGV